MYKVVDIGAVVPGTGEQRVHLLSNSCFVKTASSEIQNFWDTMPRKKDCAYLWVIGVSAMEYYGCNNNGDAFTENDLLDHHADFVSNAHVFLHHINKDPEKSVGKPVYSWYNKDMHRIELVLEINKKVAGAKGILTKLTKGEQLFVSMGCSVAYDVCSICGNKAQTRAQYCDHLRYNMKKILPDGRQVYALNPNPKFFDISLVNRPADPTAFALDKVASIVGAHAGSDYAIPSSLLGEQAEKTSVKLATLKKISDIVKDVDGIVAGSAGVFSESDIIRTIFSNGFSDFSYPDFDHAMLKERGVSPAGLLLGLASCGSHMTLGDAIYASCKHFLGKHFFADNERKVLSILPGCISLLRDEPSIIKPIVSSIFSDYNGEFDSPKKMSITIQVIRPVATERVFFVNSLLPESMNKEATDLYANPLADAFLTQANSRGSNFRTLTLPDGSKTTRYHIAQANAIDDVEPYIGLAGLGAAGLLTAVLSMLPVKPESKLFAAGLLSVPSAMLLASSSIGKNKGTPYNTLSDGTQISSYIIDQSWKHRNQVKTAEALPGVRLGTALGMLVPGALALDYAYNRWKLNSDPYSVSDDTAYTKARNSIGKFVLDNPVVSILGSGIAGSQASKLLTRILCSNPPAKI